MHRIRVRVRVRSSRCVEWKRVLGQPQGWAGLGGDLRGWGKALLLLLMMLVLAVEMLFVWRGLASDCRGGER